MHAFPWPHTLYLLLRTFATCTTCHFQCLKTSSNEGSEQGSWKIHFTYDAIWWTHGRWQPFEKKVEHMHVYPWPHTYFMLLGTFAMCTTCHFQCLKHFFKWGQQTGQVENPFHLWRYPMNSWAGGSHFEKKKKGWTYACLSLATYIVSAIGHICHMYHLPLSILKKLLHMRAANRAGRKSISLMMLSVELRAGDGHFEKKKSWKYACLYLVTYIFYVTRNICHVCHLSISMFKNFFKGVQQTGQVKNQFYV